MRYFARRFRGGFKWDEIPEAIAVGVEFDDGTKVVVRAEPDGVPGTVVVQTPDGVFSIEMDGSAANAIKIKARNPLTELLEKEREK